MMSEDPTHTNTRDCVDIHHVVLSAPVRRKRWLPVSFFAVRPQP